MNNMQIVQGDCLVAMKDIPAGSVDMVMVDPKKNSYLRFSP